MGDTEGGNKIEPTTNGLPLDVLMNLLECPVCLESATPPIYVCRIGHKICKECAPNIYRCPICRSGYLGTRDFVAEELFAKLQEAGLAGNLILQNENVDSEVSISCHLGSLSSSLLLECDLGESALLSNFASYIEHLVEKHKVCHDSIEPNATFRKRFYLRNNSFVRNGSSKLLILNCSANTFLVSMHQDVNNKIWISVAAESLKIANQFKVELKILKGNADGDCLINWCGKPNAYHQLHTQILANKTCLITNQQEMSTFAVRKVGHIICWILTVAISKVNHLDQSEVVPVSSDAASSATTQAQPAVHTTGTEDNSENLEEQILGLQSQVRNFRYDLLNRIRNEGAMGPGPPGVQASVGHEESVRVTRVPPPAARQGADFLPTVPTMLVQPSPMQTSPERHRRSRHIALGRLREHTEMELELGRLREHREMLERREREGRLRDRRHNPRTNRRPTSSIITTRDFFFDSDDEQEYINRLAEEHSSGHSQNVSSDNQISATETLSPRSGEQRRANITEFAYLSPRSRNSDQLQRQIQQVPGRLTGRASNSPPSEDTTCVIS